MEAYYRRQAELPHFSSYSRQRGSGIGALVAGIGRIALPFARKFIIPTAKKIGKDLLMEAIPELFDVATHHKSPKVAIKETLKRTAKKQLGSGAKKNRKGGKVHKTGTKARRVVRKRVIRRKNLPKRSRLNFFTNVKHVE